MSKKDAPKRIVPILKSTKSDGPSSEADQTGSNSKSKVVEEPKTGPSGEVQVADADAGAGKGDNVQDEEEAGNFRSSFVEIYHTQAQEKGKMALQLTCGVVCLCMVIPAIIGAFYVVIVQEVLREK